MLREALSHFTVSADGVKYGMGILSAMVSTHPGSTAPSPVSATATDMSGMIEITDSVTSRHVSYLRLFQWFAQATHI